MLNPDEQQPDTPSRHAIAAALTLIGVMLLGAWQIIATVRNAEKLDFPHSWLDFREGRLTGTLEKQLDQHLPARPTLIAIANSTRYLLTNSGGDQVRTGVDNWLFLTDELRYEGLGNTPLDARAALLGAASRSLDRQGVRLVIALVPDKARVYADKLSSGHYPSYHRERYNDALAALRLQHVSVVDLLQPLMRGAALRDVYYHTDTHWNQAGAQIAANAVANEVQRLGIKLDSTSFRTSNEGIATERPGDLLRLMGLTNVPNLLRPRPDTETPVITQQTSLEKTSLFGESVVPVTLIGTSYSLRGNFHGFLQQALSAKVLNAAKDGGGFLQAATAYLTDEAFHTATPSVIIWEVPERFLLTKLDTESTWLKTVNLLAPAGGK